MQFSAKRYTAVRLLSNNKKTLNTATKPSKSKKQRKAYKSKIKALENSEKQMREATGHIGGRSL